MSSKKQLPKDANQLTKSIVDFVTTEDKVEQPKNEELTADGKNAAAVALGRKGGLKGGKARAESLSAKRRKEIAQKAAAARWGLKK